MDSGCGSVGRTVSRGPWFESSHWQFGISNIRYSFEKTKKEKKSGNGPFEKCVPCLFVTVLRHNVENIIPKGLTLEAHQDSFIFVMANASQISVNFNFLINITIL